VRGRVPVDGVVVGGEGYPATEMNLRLRGRDPPGPETAVALAPRHHLILPPPDHIFPTVRRRCRRIIS
jgi:hypothetical protein